MKSFVLTYNRGYQRGGNVRRVLLYRGGRTVPDQPADVNRTRRRASSIRPRVLASSARRRYCRSVVPGVATLGALFFLAALLVGEALGFLFLDLLG